MAKEQTELTVCALQSGRQASWLTGWLACIRARPVWPQPRVSLKVIEQSSKLHARLDR